jgi:lambda family phage portal protein
VSDSAVDKFWKWWSPQRAAERALARKAIDHIEKGTGYREGTPTARDATPLARGASPDWTLEMGYDRRNMVDVARQLERVNSIASSVLDRACEHVIGEGFSLKCKTASEAWNRDTEEAWAQWCRSGADARGMMTFNEMLTIAFRSWLRDGDCAFVLMNDGSMRLIESDEIASKIGGYYKPTDADGVELDKKGRIKSFYIFDYDPTVLWPDRRRAIPRLVKIPAENVVFLARRLRAGQTRGISAFAGATWIFEQLDDCLEAVAVAHHMAAAAGWIVSKKNPLAGTGSTPGTELKMGPGKVVRLEPGEEITQLQPEHPGGTFPILVQILTRVAAARFGMSLELVNYDFTAANYSNMRAQSQETAIACRIKQRGMLVHACTSIYAWWLANEIREGRRPGRPDAHKHTWGVSGIAWQDPVTELTAAMGSVDGCLDTRRRILAARGLDFDEVVKELGDERKKIKQAGLDDMRSNLTRDYVDPTLQAMQKPSGKDRQRAGRLPKQITWPPS